MQTLLKYTILIYDGFYNCRIALRRIVVKLIVVIMEKLQFAVNMMEGA